VSLIEEASKRLEELKRSGIHVPDGLADPARRADDATTDRHEPASESRVATSPVARPTPPPGRSQNVSKRVAIDLPTLAAHGYVAPDMPHSPVAQEFRVIKRPLIANVQGKSGVAPHGANLVMVTSAVAGEGKSFCALNLAMSIAMELDSTVLLVDADVASPSLLRMLRLPDSRGLLDVLTRADADLNEVILRTNVEKLSLLPAGTPHERATELLASEAMSRLVEELATRYPDRIVVFDSPPLLMTTESPALAAHMGQIVMVVEAEQTSVSAVKQALATIEQCPIVMTVLNKATRSGGSGYYGHDRYRNTD
jgi:protein-tyrosine kinase